MCFAKADAGKFVFICALYVVLLLHEYDANRPRCICADVQYNLDGLGRLEGIMGCFNALGTVAFAYGGHNVVLEIQAIAISVSSCLRTVASMIW